MRKSMRRLDLDLDQEASFYYMEGPHLLPVDDAMEIDGFVVLLEEEEEEEEREERAWFLYDEKQPAEVPLDFITKERPFLGLDKTMAAIERVWETEGPFDGILGYSQGAVMAHLLASKRAEPGAPGWLQSLEFVICIGGFPSAAEPTPGLALWPLQRELNVPSLHISGEADASVPPCHHDRLAACFRSPTVHKYSKGHVLPQCPAVVGAISAFLQNQNLIC